MKSQSNSRLDDIVAQAKKYQQEREQTYRAKALKMYPWICGRCSRTFTHSNLHELTVHHRDHNHDNNPEDGSNWELLCLYCHDNEHQRYIDQVRYGTGENETDTAPSTHQPFSNLADLLKKQS